MLEFLYWYGTDFCINAANLMGISYMEFNVGLFLVLIPGILMILLVANLFRYLLRPLIRRKGKSSQLHP